MSKQYIKNNETNKYEKKQWFSLSFVLMTVTILTVGTYVVQVMLKELFEQEYFSKIFTKHNPILGLVGVVQLILTILLIVLGIAQLIVTFVKVKKAGSFTNYISSLKLEKVITKTLVETMAVNLMKDEPSIEVPDVKVKFEENKIIVQIEKLAGMYDVNTLREDVNSSFKGNYSKYVVVSSRVTDSRNHFIFELEDAATDRTFVPKTLEDLNMGNYRLKLQEDLILNLGERPHIAVWGKTGSGKSTVVMTILLQLLQSDTDIYVIDGKGEFRELTGLFSSISRDGNTVLYMLDDILKDLERRENYMAQEAKKRQKMGLKASETALKPLVLVADEISAVIAQLDSKQTKEFVNKLKTIILKGRSVGISVVLATQDPSTETLPQQIRSQFSTRIILGSTNSDIQKMALGELATSCDVEDFKGWYVCDGITRQPQKFHVPKLHEYGLNGLDKFIEAKNKRE
jgi:ABC-type ATPase involved in cell division